MAPDAEKRQRIRRILEELLAARATTVSRLRARHFDINPFL